jgi:hypothetical protein
MIGSKRKICLLMVLLLAAIGCARLATDHRRYGFAAIQRGFASLAESPALEEVVTLEKVTIHIVGSRQQFKWNRAAAYGSPVLGYATQNNHIYLIGKVVDGQIVINQAVLGHELNHLINQKNPRVANPDKLDDLGA